MQNSRSKSMKLVEFLGLHTPFSRRKILGFLNAGAIRVNGKMAIDLNQEIDTDGDIVTRLGQEVRFTGRRYYYKFNKPSGVVSTLSDPEGRKDLSQYVSS